MIWTEPGTAMVFRVLACFCWFGSLAAFVLGHPALAFSIAGGGAVLWWMAIVVVILYRVAVAVEALQRKTTVKPVTRRDEQPEAETYRL